MNTFGQVEVEEAAVFPATSKARGGFFVDLVGFLQCCI